MTLDWKFEPIVGMFLAVLCCNTWGSAINFPRRSPFGGGALAFVPGLTTIRPDPELGLIIYTNRR